MSNLDVGSREFFQGLEKSAFTNPFSDERIEADRQMTGAPSRTSFSAVLNALLQEIDRRLDALTPFRIPDFPAEERDSLTIGLLFQQYHRCMPKFDALIEEQVAAGDESCAAPFAAEAFNVLVGHGIPRGEAARYIAIFYQLRRAFYFISRSLIGESDCMKQLRRRLWDNIFTHDIRWYVRCLWNRMEDFSTLLLGETGTGKGAAAFSIGRSGFIPFNPSTQKFGESFTRAFTAINLSQYPEALIESELFGHRKGAFTGAVEKHDGVFARCSPHGAIFLDEIGEVGEPVQIKLLQVLQQRTFSPVGSHEQQRFEGRVIAATNKSIADLRREGKFRDDFYYRLCSDQIVVPPLRQRIREKVSELELLVGHILKRMSGEHSEGLMDPVMSVLKTGFGRGYGWPGNVRELEQAVRRILLTGSYDGDEVSVPQPVGTDLMAAIDSGSLTVRQLTEEYCKRLHARCGSYGDVARITGLDWRTVKKHVRE
jgi:DNA-binding NtrC family response regulator